MAIIDSNPIQATAGADLSAKKFRFGKFSAGLVVACSVVGERSDGIIGCGFPSANASGAGVDLYIDRIPKVECGGSFSSGDPLTTDTVGRAILASAGAAINAYALADGATGRFVAVTFPKSAAPLATNQANNQVTSGSEVIYTFSVADAATADIDIVVSEKIEVVDAYCQKQNGAGAGNSMQIKAGATAITDAMACAVDNTLTRAASIDDSASTIAAGGTLRLTATRAAGTRNALVVVRAIKRA